MGNLFEGTVGIFMVGTMILIGVGKIYWIYLAYQFGSFTMFIVGIIPPITPFAGLAGGYSMIFETPAWLINMFG
jgi:hypothetical protein